MADTRATARVLKTIPFLRGLSNATYLALARQAHERAFKAGQSIFREGTRGNTLYILQTGKVDIVKGRGKDEVTLATRRPGEFFGEMSIIEGAQRSAAARARTPVTLLEVSGEVVLRTLLKHPAVLLDTARHLSSNLRRADTTMIGRLKKKNAELRRAYTALQKAQAEIIEKKRLERELELARELQDSLLPRELPPIHDFRFAGCNRPAEVVGGAFYDVIPLGPNSFGLLIASVAGQGLFAAIFMALTRALVVSEGQRQPHPHLVASHVHRLLLQLAKPTMPVSLFYGVVDARDRSLTYVNAGHSAPLLRNVDSSATSLPGTGSQLAASLRFEADEHATTLQPGQTLVLYSDGLLHAENSTGKPFGLERLQAAVGSPIATADQAVEHILNAVDRHRGTVDQRHDEAILVVRLESA